ncbi:branched-chain amino acid transport system permease protein/neutral amino acid transport system permease protein [Limimonas halophila]|uniref:Branched-chain amino acid transport system permease protein/neutral amino acid transport system permease protein n=1 Tax=Limimonas halophila TaxID=1082479 RepID=A0A1G7NWI5_9PROT|nr:branched-chain amino acid ABC transporter permease [Limimonas halophila]SDF78331.1 branched-chain amino acid transport system permease protein/neutral amino acid transport system permease protein [Limimonas halophila]
MTEFLQLTVYGLVLGSIVSLGAIGLSLVYGILRFPHFAHGDYITLGAYLALAVVQGVSVSTLVALPVGVAGTAATAIAIDQVLYRRLRRVAPVILLIASVGVALILRSLIQIVWGPSNQVYETGITMPYRVGGVNVSPDHIVIFLGAIALMVALHLFLQKTKMGKAMRAMSDNADLAQVTGIRVNTVIIWTWIIGGGLAAAAGIFLGMDTRLHPVMGWRILLPVFAAAILGGIGRPYGAVVGGLIIGLAQEYSTIAIPPSYKPAVAFAIMVIMLVVRPTGLFAGRKA